MGLRTPNRGFDAFAEPLGLGMAGLLAGLFVLLVGFELSTAPGSGRSSRPRIESRLAARLGGGDPLEGVAFMARALAWMRAARTWQLHPGAWRTVLLEQRILLGWSCTEIETAWLEEAGTPLAELRFGRPVETLSDAEVAGLLTGMQSPGGIRWALCSDDPRAESIRNVLRTGETERPDGWALWCSDARPP